MGDWRPFRDIHNEAAIRRETYIEFVGKMAEGFVVQAGFGEEGDVAHYYTISTVETIADEEDGLLPYGRTWWF